MSDFVVSARKYRPMRFDEVVGQQHVSQTLKNAMKNNHLAHAFLFCGPRGVGKTTCARILAKVLNCENVTADHEPCNTCNSCKSFNGNASFNITELDAASNNSVEHIRALIEQVRFQPQQGKYKIYIIDEVHMLSQQAFNAFLKTLEEPPPYAKFILATTEKHKILPTILSRCQIFDFNRIQIADMVSHLQAICEEEKIAAEKDALHIVAQKADGALRDALSIFDRIVSFSNEEIRYEDVITNLNVLDYDYYFQILDALLIEDVSRVLLLFDQILRKGFDADVFVNGLAEHFRNILVSKDKATVQLLEVGDALKKRYLEQATITPQAFLLTGLNLANDCDINYKMARNKKLHVEMSLIKMTYINRAIQVVQNPFVTQKKTDDASLVAAPTVNYTATKQTTQPVEQVKEETVAKTPTGKIALPKKLGGGLGMLKGGGKLSLAAIEAEVEAENAGKEVEKPAFTVENVKKEWDAYAKKVSSQFVQNSFKMSKYEIDGLKLNIMVAGAVAENNIKGERKFLEAMKETFGLPEMEFVFIIDPTKAEKPKAPKKPVTPRQIYKSMRDTNPMIDELQKKFQLFPDKK